MQIKKNREREVMEEIVYRHRLSGVSRAEKKKITAEDAEEPQR